MYPEACWLVLREVEFDWLAEFRGKNNELQRDFAESVRNIFYSEIVRISVY